MGNGSMRGLTGTESNSAVTRSVVATWTFLFVFVVVAGLVLWPAGLSGWRFTAVGAGALVGAITARHRLRFREFLWFLSDFLMGGPLIVVVFNLNFGVRQSLGVVLLITLLIFDINRKSPRRLANHHDRSKPLPQLHRDEI